MKLRYLFICLLTVLLLLSCEKETIIIKPVGDVETIEKPNSSLGDDRSKESILSYLDQVIREDKIIVGQHCGEGPDDVARYFETYVDELFNQTGKYVSLLGAEFGYSPTVNDYPIRTLVDHWEKGGLITINWSVDNPYVDGYDVRWNSVDNNNTIDLTSLVKDAPESAARTKYRNELNRVAGALQKLRDAGVTVIWRPMNEMNSNWFWWGIDEYNNNQTNAGDYVALWVDLYTTLTVEYGLDELIWVYAPSTFQGWNGEVLAQYPGSEYVDLVGVSNYNPVPNFPQDDYNVLASTGKTMVMCEAGPIDEGYGNWDEVALVNNAKGRVAYFLQWHSWVERDGLPADVAIKDNKNADVMMNRDDVITLDKL